MLCCDGRGINLPEHWFSSLLSRGLRTTRQRVHFIVYKVSSASMNQSFAITVI